jgi:hypothetical protein
MNFLINIFKNITFKDWLIILFLPWLERWYPYFRYYLILEAQSRLKSVFILV